MVQAQYPFVEWNYVFIENLVIHGFSLCPQSPSVCPSHPSSVPCPPVSLSHKKLTAFLVCSLKPLSWVSSFLVSSKTCLKNTSFWKSAPFFPKILLAFWVAHFTDKLVYQIKLTEHLGERKWEHEQAGIHTGDSTMGSRPGRQKGATCWWIRDR